MTAPPGLKLNNVFDVALQVAVILFVLELYLGLATLPFVVTELLGQVFLSL